MPLRRSASIWVCLPGSSEVWEGDCYIMGHPINRALNCMDRQQKEVSTSQLQLWHVSLQLTHLDPGGSSRLSRLPFIPSGGESVTSSPSPWQQGRKKTDVLSSHSQTVTSSSTCPLSQAPLARFPQMSPGQWEDHSWPTANYPGPCSSATHVAKRLAKLHTNFQSIKCMSTWVWLEFVAKLMGYLSCDMCHKVKELAMKTLLTSVFQSEDRGITQPLWGSRPNQKCSPARVRRPCPPRHVLDIS